MGELVILTVGQAPRPDLQELFRQAGEVSVRVTGALDGLSQEEVDRLHSPQAEYPILCRLANGSTALIDRTYLAVRLQSLLDNAAKSRTRAAVVACTAEFPELTADFPVFIPGHILPALVSSLGFGPDVAVVTSNPGQIRAARRKWAAASFKPYVTSGDLRDEPAQAAFQSVAADMGDRGSSVIVLDCFGHDETMRLLVSQVTQTPVLVARTLTAAIVANVIGPGSTTSCHHPPPA